MSTFTVPISSGQPTKDNHYCNSSSLGKDCPKDGFRLKGPYASSLKRTIPYSCVCVCVFHILFSETIQEEKTLFCSFWSDRKPRRLWATRDSGTGFWWRKVWSSLSGLLDSWLDSVSRWGALFELISLSKWKAEIANRCSFQPYVTESPWAGQTEPIVPGCIFVFDGAGGGNLGFAEREFVSAELHPSLELLWKPDGGCGSLVSWVL